MRRLALVCAALALPLLSLPSRASAQWPPNVSNLQVLPKETPFSTLVDTMKAFTRALGVRCTYCHVGREGMPLDSMNFASDDITAKKKAREMLRMVAAINGQYLANLPERRDPPIAVSCMTCHRGSVDPRPTQQQGGEPTKGRKY